MNKRWTSLQIAIHDQFFHVSLGLLFFRWSEVWVGNEKALGTRIPGVQVSAAAYALRETGVTTQYHIYNIHQKYPTKWQLMFLYWILIFLTKEWNKLSVIGNPRRSVVLCASFVLSWWWRFSRHIADSSSSDNDSHLLIVIRCLNLCFRQHRHLHRISFHTSLTNDTH